MANKDQLKLIKEGVNVWNDWRTKHPGVKVDISKANLRKDGLKFLGNALCVCNISNDKPCHVCKRRNCLCYLLYLFNRC